MCPYAGQAARTSVWHAGFRGSSRARSVPATRLGRDQLSLGSAEACGPTHGLLLLQLWRRGEPATVTGTVCPFRGTGPLGPSVWHAGFPRLVQSALGFQPPVSRQRDQLTRSDQLRRAVERTDCFFPPLTERERETATDTFYDCYLFHWGTSRNDSTATGGPTNQLGKRCLSSSAIQSFYCPKSPFSSQRNGPSLNTFRPHSLSFRHSHTFCMRFR